MLKKNTRTRAERTVSVQEREESPLQIADKVDATVVFLMTVAFFLVAVLVPSTSQAMRPLLRGCANNPSVKSVRSVVSFS